MLLSRSLPTLGVWIRFVHVRLCLQLSGAMLTWAWCLAIIYVMCIMRLMSLGTIRHELFQITFHAIPYFGIILSRLLPRGTLPGWQVGEEHHT